MSLVRFDIRLNDQVRRSSTRDGELAWVEGHDIVRLCREDAEGADLMNALAFIETRAAFMSVRGRNGCAEALEFQVGGGPTREPSPCTCACECETGGGCRTRPRRGHQQFYGPGRAGAPARGVRSGVPVTSRP